MNSQYRQQQLNESKFLAQQINTDEIPTQQQIIDRAQELNIDDLSLAKQSLLKELDDNWKPYINRYQQIYYINLEQQKGYIDHPIDMQIKITYAIKNKKKLPVFTQYSIQQMSQNPRLILQEIKKYKHSHKLNIVYQQSQEQSMRKQTKMNQQQENQVDELYIQKEVDQQIQKYQRQLRLNYEKQKIAYKKQRQQYYQNRQKKHKQAIKNLKLKRLQDLSIQIQKDWLNKNEFNFNKSLQNAKQQFQNKKQRLLQLYDKEQQLQMKITNNNQTGLDVKRFYKQKMIKKKQQLYSAFQRNIHIQFRNKMASHLREAQQRFNKNVQSFTASKINYKSVIEQNFKALSHTSYQYNKKNNNTQDNSDNQMKNNTDIKSKRKFRIFDMNKGRQNLQEKLASLNVNEPIWSKNQHIIHQIEYCKYVAKPSLSLRLMKKIL